MPIMKQENCELNFKFYYWMLNNDETTNITERHGTLDGGTTAKGFWR